MSEILNTFSSPITGSILGIVSIVATAAVGITIFLMQRRADGRINDLIKQIHEMIHHEDERKKSITRYYIRRIKSDFENINKNYNDLKQSTEQHIDARSEESWKKLSLFSNRIFPPRVDSFITVTDDIRTIIPFLDNPYLIDKFGLIRNVYGDELKLYAKQLGEYESRENEDINKIKEEMDSVMGYVNRLRDLLMNEVDNILE